jgi:hypothetical protein
VAEVRKGKVTTKVREDPVGEPVYMQYTGTRVGSFSVTGDVTRRSYRVNRNTPVFIVDSEDSEELASRPDFRIMSRVSNQPTLTRTSATAAEQVAREITNRFPSKPVKQSRPVSDRGTSKPNLPPGM